MTLIYDVSLAGRVALVTGAARNLPAVIAAEFAAAGAAVAINDVTHQDQAEALAASIEEKGGRAAVFMADVADRRQLVRTVDEVQDESSKGLGTVDILINSAGPFAMDPFRIKIWEEDGDGNETVIYDNGFDQGIAGGSIVVHTSKK